jgi:hypothetical protein
LRKKKKFGWRKLNFGWKDSFLDHLMYLYNDRYNYVPSFLYWSFFEKTQKKICQEKWDYTSGTEGVHTKTIEVLAAHRSIMFMTTQDDASTCKQTDQDKSALDTYL